MLVCSCNANEVLAFLQNSYIQKYKLYLQLHKKIKPKGKARRIEGVSTKEEID